MLITEWALYFENLKILVVKSFISPVVISFSKATIKRVFFFLQNKHGNEMVITFSWMYCIIKCFKICVHQSIKYVQFSPEYLKCLYFMSVIKFSPEGDILKLYSWSSIKERGKKKKRTFYLPSWNYQDVTVSMTSQSSKCKKQNQCPFLKDCSRTD